MNNHFIKYSLPEFISQQGASGIWYVESETNIRFLELPDVPEIYVHMRKPVPRDRFPLIGVRYTSQDGRWLL